MEILKKRCRICGELLTIEAFGRDRKRKDGKKGECKECRAREFRDWLNRNIEKHRESVRRWNKNNPILMNKYNKEWKNRNPERNAITCKEWRKDNPEKIAADVALNRAVRRGELVNIGWCQLCGRDAGGKKVEAHHGSYLPEHYLDVVWLCRRHHREIHQWLKEKEERSCGREIGARRSSTSGGS